jgi:hypothetical protein
MWVVLSWGSLLLDLRAADSVGVSQSVVPRAMSCSPRNSRLMDASAVSDWLQSG